MDATRVGSRDTGHRATSNQPWWWHNFPWIAKRGSVDHLPSVEKTDPCSDRKLFAKSIASRVQTIHAQAYRSGYRNSPPPEPSEHR